MVHPGVHDLDYLVARLHGRCGRLAQGERLDLACHCATVADLARTYQPELAVSTARAFQQHLLAQLAGEAAEIAGHLQGAHCRLVAWMVVQLAVENLKVRLRGILSGPQSEQVAEHLLSLPENLELNPNVVADADSLLDFTSRLPPGALRDSLRDATMRYRDQDRPFYFEAALDSGYLRELLARTQDLPSDDRRAVQPLVCQQVDQFHLMLIARGRFLHGLLPEMLAPLHVPGATISARRFAAILSAADPATAVSQVPARLPGGTASARPPDPEILETLGWRRLLQLARQALRHHHTGFGSVVAYLILRRIEVMNLVTVSEGIRMSMPADAIRALLIPRSNRKKADV